MSEASKKMGRSAADRMVSGEQTLKTSVDEFVEGAIKNGCPEQLANFILFGFWMGANASVTRAMKMMENCNSGEESGNQVSDLMEEINTGLQDVEISKMFPDKK